MQHIAEADPHEKALFSQISVTFLKYRSKGSKQHYLTSFVLIKNMLQGLFTNNKKKISHSNV